MLKGPMVLKMRIPHWPLLLVQQVLFVRAQGGPFFASTHSSRRRSHGSVDGDLLGVCGGISPAWLEDFCEFVTSACTIVLAMLAIFFLAFSLARCLLHKSAFQNLYVLWSPSPLGRFFGMRCRLKFPGGDCHEGDQVAVVVGSRYERAEFKGAVGYNQTYQAQFRDERGTTVLLLVDDMLDGGLCTVAPQHYVGFAPASLEDIRRGLKRSVDDKPENQAKVENQIGRCAVACVIC